MKEADGGASECSYCLCLKAASDPRRVLGADDAGNGVVALRDISAFHTWIERESPSKTAQSAARGFIAGADLLVS